MTACRIWVLLYVNISNCINILEHRFYFLKYCTQEAAWPDGNIEYIHIPKVLPLVHISTRVCGGILVWHSYHLHFYRRQDKACLILSSEIELH